MCGKEKRSTDRGSFTLRPPSELLEKFDEKCGLAERSTVIYRLMELYAKGKIKI
jgi:hypothetical protein